MAELVTVDKQLPHNHKYWCEMNYCRNRAAFEWIAIVDNNDGFPMVLIAYRCDDHPVSDPLYECRPLGKLDY